MVTDSEYEALSKETKQKELFHSKIISYFRIISSIAIIILIIKSYTIGPIYGMSLVKGIGTIYAVPGGTGFGFAILLLIFIFIGHLFSISLIVMLCVLFKMKKITFNKMLSISFFSLFYFHLLTILFCILQGVLAEGIHILRIFSTFAFLFCAPITIYFPFFIFLSGLNIFIGTKSILENIRR